MDTRRRLLILLFLVIAVAALVFLAAGLPRLDLHGGEPFSLGGNESLPSSTDSPFSLAGSDTVSGVVLSFFFAAYIPFAVLIYIIICIVSKESRKKALIFLLRFGVIILCVYLLLRRHVFDWLWPARPPTPPSSEELGVALPPPFATNPPPWLAILISFVVLVALGLLSWWLMRFLRLRSDSRGDTLRQVAEEAREALADIQAGAALKDTVLRCYAEMSRAVSSRRGIHRAKAMTPREFEDQLGEAGLPLEPVQRLTRLFELVRYGARPLGSREEEEAVASLNAIIEAIGSMS